MSELKFINDKEIDNLNGNKDLLETKRYANTLKETILSAETPFTIGLFGEWGSGKSSIVNTVQDELKNHTSEKIKFIKYDAWKYANDSFRRMFIKEVQRELKFDGTDKFNSFYANKTIDTNINSKFNWKYFSLIFIAFILVIVIVPFFNMNRNLELTLQSIITFFAVVVAFFKNSFSEYKVSAQKPMIFAPEQFENIFDEMMSKSLKKYNIFSQMKEWFQGNYYEKDIDKVVIIIDNIDRCDKETAYELLTNIKNFLERKGIIFVVPIDDSALRRHLKDKNNEDGKEADEFLRKFFNVTLKIKHFRSRDLFMFTNDINKHHGLNLQPDTVDIIAKEYATNPRRIIQLLNNLISELNVVQQKYNNDFSIKYESLIALLLIVREEWSCVYKQIASKPHLLKKTDDIVFDKDSKIEENITHFFNRTKAVYENVNEQIIEKLVSNMDNDEKIPSEIIDNIKNSNYDELDEYIELDEHFKELLYYLIQELETEITRKTFKIGALNRFKNIIHLNELKEIPVDVNKKLYSMVHNQQSELIKIIENLDEDNFNRFYKFVETNQKQNLKYLEEISIKQYKKIWKEKVKDKNDIKDIAKIWIGGFGDYINNSTNIEMIKDLRENFLNCYDYFFDELPLYDNSWINEDKIKYIIDEKFITYLFESIDSKLDSNSFKELLYFSKLKLLNIKYVEPLFEKGMINLNELYNTTEQEEAKTQFIKNALTNIEKIIELLKNIVKINEFKSDKIITYLTWINQNHNIKYQHPQYKEYAEYHQTVIVNISKYIHEEEQQILLNLYFEIYRTTSNYTNVSNYMISLVTKYKHLENSFFKSLIKLRDSNSCSLVSLFNYLINLDNIDEDLFNLYEQFFIRNKTDNEEVKIKLERLIEKYLTEQNDIIEQFLINILKYNKTKEILTSIVVDLPTESVINKLPKRIQHLTYDYLCENDKLFEVESKIDFIKEILAFDNKYKDCIVKVIVSKLQEKSKVEGALEILEGFSNPTKEQKSALYNALKTQKTHPEFGKSIVKLMKKYDDKNNL